MGITGFLSNFDTKFYKNKKFNSVYIDCNYIIHLLINKCNDNKDFKNKINKYIKYLLDNIETSIINLIFDGEYNGDKYNNPKLFKIRKYPEHINYETQPIKPKTEIVKFFKETIINSIVDYKKLLMLNIKIKVNDDYINGEADFKILEMISNDKYNNNLIISKDSDMILIAMSCMINIDELNIDIIINPNKMEYILINQNYLKKDYILLYLFLGNDYLPKISNVKYEWLIQCYSMYIEINDEIIQNNTIDNKKLINYFCYMTKIIKNNKGKLSFSLKSLNKKRFKNYFNNIKWCLNLYNVINYNKQYKEDTNDIVNIYNFIYFL